MQPSKTVVRLSALIVVLVLVAAGTGLFWHPPGETFTFTTLRGETAEIYGRGLYYYDTIFAAAGYRAVDLTLLAFGLPALIACTLLYRRGSLRGGLLLTAVLAYFLYAYVSYAFGAAYNRLFLVYVALFSLVFFAFVITFTSIDLRSLTSTVLADLPRTGPAIFMIVAGVATSVIWLAPLIGSMLQDRPPDLLYSYTTMVTDALDVALITPLSLLSGILILRRKPLGYRIAFPLLGIILLLIPQIILGTLFQLRAGVEYSPGEIVGPISGFVILGLFAIWVTLAILRKMPD